MLVLNSSKGGSLLSVQFNWKLILQCITSLWVLILLFTSFIIAMIVFYVFHFVLIRLNSLLCRRRDCSLSQGRSFHYLLNFKVILILSSLGSFGEIIIINILRMFRLLILSWVSLRRGGVMQLRTFLYAASNHSSSILCIQVLLLIFFCL